MNNLIQLASHYLINKYNPHTVILYGSRARGDATEASDIDIACFCDEGVEAKEAGLFQGVYLDAWVYPTSYMQTVPDDALRFSEGIILLDNQGIGARYLIAVEEKLQRGPKNISLAEREHLTQWIHKMLKRVAVGDPCGNYRKAWLHFELLEAYFKLRNLWFLGDKKSFAYLQQNDKEGYQLFEAAYQDVQDYNNLKLLAAYVLNW